jgi:hypothetical protein
VRADAQVGVERVFLAVLEPDLISVPGRDDHRWKAYPGTELGLAGGVLFVSPSGTKKSPEQAQLRQGGRKPFDNRALRARRGFALSHLGATVRPQPPRPP